MAIELDGEIHLKKDVRNRDENRDGFLKEFGIKTLRIRNDMIINNILKTLEPIRRNLTSPKSSPY